MKLLQCLSLPQRLIVCIFNPVLLFFLYSLLLTIWSNYVIIGARSGQPQDAPAATTVTVSATATNVNTKVSASHATATVTATSAFYVDSTKLKSIASDYVEDRIDDVNVTMVAFYDSLLTEWQKSLDSWNTSLSVAMGNQRATYLSMLSYNDTITQILYEKSAEINSTWGVFAQTALTAVELQGNQLFQNFSVDYWFVNALFHNVSQDLTKLESYSLNIENPVLGTKFSPPRLNSSRLLDNSIANFTDSMMLHTNQKNAGSISKRDFSPASFENLLFYKCRTLTVICLVAYLASVLALCIYQWLTFRLETSLFSVHMVEFFDMLVDQQGKIITLQQNMRQYSRDLFSTLNAPLVYYMSNFVDGASQRLDVGWKLKFYFIYWVYSSGRYLLILLFYTLVHWQVMVALTTTGTSRAQINYRRTTDDLAVREDLSTSNEVSVLTNVLSLCTNFTTGVNQIINETLVTQFEGLLRQQADSINSRMSSFIEAFNITEPPRWDDLSYEDPCVSQNSGASVNDLTNNVINYAIYFGTPKSSQDELSKRSMNKLSVLYGNLAWDRLYRWAMLSIVIILFLHLILGLTVFPRL